MRVISALCAVLVVAPLLADDEVTTITFDGVLGPEESERLFMPTYVVDGWAFTGYEVFPTDFRILADGFVDSDISNGTDWGFVQNNPIFELVRVNGDPFDLFSLDAGQAFWTDAGTLTVTGRFAEGSDLVEEFPTLEGEFDTYTFDESWRDLVSVRVESSSNFLAVDNVVLECGIFLDGFEEGSTGDWSSFDTGPAGPATTPPG